MSQPREPSPSLDEAIAPTGRPVQNPAQFSGRQDALRRLFDVMRTPGRHAVVHGERGIGKTSFHNVAAQLLSESGVAVLRIGGRPGAGFAELMREAAADVRLAPNMEMKLAPLPPGEEVPEDEVEPLAGLLPEGDFAGGELAALFAGELGGPFVVLVDDFDRIGDAMTDRAFADFVKALAAGEADTTVVLTGRADSPEEMIVNYDQVFRYLEDVPLRVLSPAEILFLVERLEAATGLSVDEDAKKLTITASQGLPGTVLDLARRAVAAARAGGSARVTPTHVMAALEGAVAEADPAVREAFATLVGDDADDDFARTLYAVAVAHTDWYGRFFKTQIAVSLARRFPELAQGEDEVVAFLDSLTGEDDPALFRKRGTEYRFRDIRMKQYLVMLYLSKRFRAEGAQAVTNAAKAAAG